MTTEFQRLVYAKTRDIPMGRVSTYKEIARAVGRPGAYRAVGNSLNKNPMPIEVPCHRVVRSDLRVGGFSKGAESKRQLLEGEGVRIEGGRVVGRIFTF